MTEPVWRFSFFMEEAEAGRTATRSAGVVQQFQRRACRVEMQVVVQRVMKRA